MFQLILLNFEVIKMILKTVEWFQAPQAAFSFRSTLTSINNKTVLYPDKCYSFTDLVEPIVKRVNC